MHTVTSMAAGGQGLVPHLPAAHQSNARLSLRAMQSRRCFHVTFHRPCHPLRLPSPFGGPRHVPHQQQVGHCQVCELEHDHGQPVPARVDAFPVDQDADHLHQHKRVQHHHEEHRQQRLGQVVPDKGEEQDERTETWTSKRFRDIVVTKG